MLIKITYIIVLLTLTQCQEASNFQAGGNKDPDQMSAEEEGVVPPTNISGAYLTCATEVEPSVQLNAGVVGCRLSDKENNKIDTDSLPVKYYMRPAGNPASVEIRESLSPNDNRYDKLYFFLGQTNIPPTETRAVMNQATFGAQFNDENNNPRNIGGVFSQIEVSKNSIPEPANINYPQVVVNEAAKSANSPVNDSPVGE